MSNPVSPARLPDDPDSGHRRIRARIAANTRWAYESDRTAATAAARAAADRRFEQQVDPDGVLPAHERAVRADAARRVHFLRMSLASARARRKARHGEGEPAA